MGDILRGRTTNVVDGDTFDFKIDWRHPENKHKAYPRQIRVRLREGDAPERGERGWILAKLLLSAKVMKPRLELEVFAYRRQTNRNIAKVYTLDSRGRRTGEVRVPKL
jgi:endonuclease YncB( thermonuclease family)